MLLVLLITHSKYIVLGIKHGIDTYYLLCELFIIFILIFLIVKLKLFVKTESEVNRKGRIPAGRLC